MLKDILDRSDSFALEGRLIQGKWHTAGDDGREMACILGSYGPDVNEPGDCPSGLMPDWMAGMLPALFDGLPTQNWPTLSFFALGLNARLRRSLGWAPERWERVRVRFLVDVIDEALNNARPEGEPPACWAQVESACRQVQEALQGKGDLAAAYRAAWAAAAAEAAAALPAQAAAEAAWSARAAEAAAATAAGAALASWLRIAGLLFAAMDAEGGK